ncbi:glycosyltransferase family 8 protein [Spirosoma endbachense]|uniref:Glycosyltransferase family 8 protein n=1 Tax=Spirosoma endbachense TaxID=2666025 RepID=A0A6P1VWX9_9BACT|nr:glycosyltransferase family 8 protein [Spirosoma endbachense]QHV96582.1 glycosyltransferase family 8 protein [Spirosoma endbachense]
MNTKERISIVLASDNHYAILIAALVKSIELNHKTDEAIDFYIIDDRISTGNKEKIQASVQSKDIAIHWLNAEQVVPSTIKFPIDNTAFPLTAYFRVFSPYVVPADLERIIYLDVDMIVLEDISKLWTIDMGDNIFGAVQDFQKVVSCSWGGIPNYKELGMAPDTKYFNSGLLLINAKAWREADITNKVFKCLHDNLQYINFADQYGLNVALVNQWFELDPRWNWFATFENKNPFIIHYLDIKPIFKSYKSDPYFQTVFFNYLKLTPWKNYKPISGNYRLVRKIYNKVKKIVLRSFKAEN